MPLHVLTTFHEDYSNVVLSAMQRVRHALEKHTHALVIHGIEEMKRPEHIIFVNTLKNEEVSFRST